MLEKSAKRSGSAFGIIAQLSDKIFIIGHAIDFVGGYGFGVIWRFCN
jgi:hypothetical protein